ncbi:MAG: hypothetical protein IJB86_11110 [Clostridia bacterium]|nr:hypothetical protein [Clostridia bacterium]
MFSVIEIVDNKRGKLFFPFIRKPPELLKVAVKDGAPYFKIKVQKYKKIPWDDILYMAGRCASNVIVDEKIELPFDLNVRRFVPEILPMKILFNTVHDLLDFLNIKKAIIGINDPDAKYCDFIALMVRYCSEIRVLTYNNQKYEDVCLQIFDEYGLSVILTEVTDSLKKCDYIISEKSTDESITFSLYGKDDSRMCAEVINLPPVYSQKLPEGVGELTFASALYELCGVKRLGKLRYSGIFVDGKYCFINEIENNSKVLFGTV